MEIRDPRAADAGQTDLVARYCEEAEQLLADATDYESALRLRDEVCGRFQNECRSALIVNATRDYLTQIISHTWRQNHESNH